MSLHFFSECRHCQKVICVCESYEPENEFLPLFGLTCIDTPELTPSITPAGTPAIDSTQAVNQTLLSADHEFHNMAPMPEPQTHLTLTPEQIKEETKKRKNEKRRDAAKRRRESIKETISSLEDQNKKLLEHVNQLFNLNRSLKIENQKLYQLIGEGKRTDIAQQISMMLNENVKLLVEIDQLRTQNHSFATENSHLKIKIDELTQQNNRKTKRATNKPK